MQFPGQGKQPLGVVFDCNLGDGIDGALALALLHGCEGKNSARLISTSTTKSTLRSAALGDALEKFFAGPPPAPSSPGFAFQRPVPPIGMADNGKLAEDTPMMKAVLDQQADDKPVYPHNILKLNDTADPTAQIRNALTAQSDDNCVVVLAGPATNLVKVLDLPGSMELIKRKVKLLAWAMGAFPEGAGGFSTRADPVAARRLLSDWPTAVVASGAEVGDALPFPGASIDKDFAWAPHHPIVDAYRAFHSTPYDAPAPAMAAMLYAVHSEGYFNLSAPGNISVLPDGRTRFAPASAGRHRYLVADPALKEKVLASYVELASAKPVPRAPRFRRQQAVDPAKPDAAKKEPDPVKQP